MGQRPASGRVITLGWPRQGNYQSDRSPRKWQRSLRAVPDDLAALIVGGLRAEWSRPRNSSHPCHLVNEHFVEDLAEHGFLTVRCANSSRFLTVQCAGHLYET